MNLAQKAIKPSRHIPHSQALWVQNDTGDAIPANTIVSLVGASSGSGGLPSIETVLPTSLEDVSGLGQLWVTAQRILDQGEGRVVPFIIVREANTSGTGVGDPVFLAADGTFTKTEPAVSVQIGQVLNVSATQGVVLLHPSAFMSALQAKQFVDTRVSVALGFPVAHSLGRTPQVVLMWPMTSDGTPISLILANPPADDTEIFAPSTATNITHVSILAY